MNVSHFQCISLFSFKQFLHIPTNNWKSNRVWIRRLECNVTTLNVTFRGLKGNMYKPENLFMLITESKKKKNPEDKLYFEMISQERWKIWGFLYSCTCFFRDKNKKILCPFLDCMNLQRFLGLQYHFPSRGSPKALIDSSLLYLSLVTKDLLINTCAKGS